MEETSSEMKDTFALRRQWIIAEAPQVSTVLQKFPALKTSKYVSNVTQLWLSCFVM